MSLTYTRKDIRNLINDIIRDSSNGLHSIAKKNRLIDRVHRDFIERTESNLNVIVFSLDAATPAGNGTIEYDRNGHKPTVTRIALEGRSYYTVENCVLLDRLCRWDDTDSSWKQLAPKTQLEIDQEGLLLSSDTIPSGYQMLDAPDTFQFLPALEVGTGDYKFEVRYRERFRDFITYEGSPADSTVVQTTGTGLSDFTAAVTNATIPSKYKIVIDTAATPDKVDTYKDILDGNGWVQVGNAVSLTGSAQAIADNVTFTAAATTGHTLADVFEFAVDDLLEPSCPSQFRHVITNGVAAELLRIERDPEYQGYLMQYENDIERIKRKVRRWNSDQASKIRNDYVGAGG